MSNLQKICPKLEDVKIIDSYAIDGDVHPKIVDIFTNPVTQFPFVITNNASLPMEYQQHLRPASFIVEIGFLPGVTDNVGATASELVSLTAGEPQKLYSSKQYVLFGDVTAQNATDIAASLHNALIQRASIIPVDQALANGFTITIPTVTLAPLDNIADEVDLLNATDEQLIEIGKIGIENADGSRRGPLGLSLLYMQAIRDYFRDVEKRNPKDIELETLAQTWSEHCKHTIFASPIDDLKEGLYKGYIKRATQEIRTDKGKDDFCVSVFSDNAGGIVFDDDWLITDKVETHNSPSALDPFGGAITGIVGVNRDCLGFGQGAKPILNRYGFCVADPRKDITYYRGKGQNNPTLSPETILKGVVAGVESGGNQSGIPTPQGFVYFDDRYVGKPLVFAGTVGLIPREINGKPSHEKSAQPGDRIIMAGGRVGSDGIHGATFSSVALDEGSPATAVQIGDPITQKKMSDAIIRDIRDKGLYNAITDNGAGGLSSSVGEMAEGSGGFILELDKVPLKYPGLSPWEIWISESQERMTMAVPADKVEEIVALFAARGVEASDIGEFTDSGRAVATWNNDPIMDMTMEFLHDGIPETPLETTFTRGGQDEPGLPQPSDYAQTIIDMMARPNIASKEFIATQYDHNVQGSAVLGPIQGKGRVYSDASVSRPLLDNPRGVVLSQGLAPRYSDIDTHDMARASLDLAVRHALAAGGDIKHMALLDNICWCSSDEPERLGQLKRAMSGIYHLAKRYGTPFVSGKDSMFNDFKGYDADDNEVKISAPPTVLISAIGVMKNVDQTVSVDVKQAGDFVYIIGETLDELGGSEYYDHHGVIGNNVPEVKSEALIDRYQRLSQINAQRLLVSNIAVGLGGLAAALAKKSIAGQMGMDITLPTDQLSLDKMLFSETMGRFVVTIAPEDQQAFESAMPEAINIGTVTSGEQLNINGFSADIKALENSYKGVFHDF